MIKSTAFPASPQTNKVYGNSNSQHKITSEQCSTAQSAGHKNIPTAIERNLDVWSVFKIMITGYPLDPIRMRRPNRKWCSKSIRIIIIDSSFSINSSNHFHFFCIDNFLLIAHSVIHSFSVVLDSMRIATRQWYPETFWKLHEAVGWFTNW